MPDNERREIVGVFHDEPSLQKAVDELLIAGFDRSACSLVADPAAVEKKLGHPYQKAVDLEDDDDVPRIAYIGRDSRVEAEGVAIGVPAYVGAVFAAGIIAATDGTVLAVMAGTAAGGLVGGIIGAQLARYIGRHHTRYLAAQLAKGGLLLWVRVHDPEQEKHAGEILGRNGAEDVHGHDLGEIDYSRRRGGLSYSLSFMNRLGL